jgi:outer membrane protein assembly factor BamB
MNGKLQWQKNFGVLKSVFFIMKNAEWEFGSSPIIYNGVLIIQCDVLENSFVAAYDLKTGKEKWKTMRDEYPGWCTPNIYKNGDQAYVAVNGFKRRGGYDFETGREVWNMSGGGDIQIPSPITGKDVIFFNSAHGKSSPIMSVSTGAKGDITLKEGETSNKYIKWYLQGAAHTCILCCYIMRLYNANWNGIVNCLIPSPDRRSIMRNWAGKELYASPVASDGRIS